MTEAELIETSAMYNGLMYEWVSLYFSAFTAFIVTAHLVGSKLTRGQVLFVSGGFVVLSVLSTLGAYGTGVNMTMYAKEVMTLNPNRSFLASYPLIYATVSLLVFGVLGSLKFMWDVRHPGHE